MYVNPIIFSDSYKGREYYIYSDIYYLNIPPTWDQLGWSFRSKYDVLTIYHDLYVKAVANAPIL